MAKGNVSELEAPAGLQPTRPFECSWNDCPKSFNRKSDLQRHFRIHTNERPYYCTHTGCSKTFIQRSALTVHNRTHTGEKPHRCKHEGCGKKFSDSSSLARHRRIHSGERNYVCEVPDCRKEFCRKTTLTKHAKKHPVEGSSMIDDLPEDSGDEDWDSESEGSPQDPTMATSQTMSRPGSCYSNHWRLPAETVQQTQFPQPGNPARCLESPLEAIKLERSTSSSPPFDRSMTDPICSYQYVQRPNGNVRKPPPLRTTALAPDFRSVPMEPQYSNDTNMETFQSPQAVTTPSYNQLSDANSFNSAGMYVQPQRYNSFPQPRVHDIHLDDSMSVSQKSNAGTPSVGQFSNSAEPMSAQTSPFSMGGALSEQLQAYANMVPVQQQQYTEQQANLIEDLRYQMPMASYPAYGGLPVPDWYTNIKPEETWPGYSLPSDRVPNDF